MGVTLITGASSGMGYSLARRLAHTGERMVLVSRRYEALAALAAEIEAEGGRAWPISCDVTDLGQVRAVVGEAELRAGPVTRLVAHAGGGEPTFVEAFDATGVEYAMRLNLMGVANCVDAVLPGMLARGEGHLVATGSLAGRLAMPTAAAYGAAKAGVAHLMDSLRIDLRGSGIDVTLLEPGFVNSRDKPATKRGRPFRVGREAAVTRMSRAILARRRRCAFPWPLVAMGMALRCLPAGLRDSLLAGKGRTRKASRQAPSSANEGEQDYRGVQNMAEATAATRPKRRLAKKLGKKLFRGSLLRFLSKQSTIPDEPVLDNDLFPWARELQAEWPAIREELDQLMQQRDRLPDFQEISPDQYRISPDSQWKTFMFYGFGERVDFGCSMCPRTAQALDRIPNLTTAFFSILAPGKHVPRHRGVTKGLVRAHLGLRVPGEADKCLMEVGGQPCVWREGELFFFDDTYPHEVWNNTDEPRAVLLLDVERPMRLPGRLVSRSMLWVLRRTGYFKDAMRNQRAWEKRFRAQQASENV